MSITERINRMAARLKIAPEEFVLFSAVKCLEDMESLERIMDQPEIRDQLRDCVELHKLGSMTGEDLAREVEELLALPNDDVWTPEA